MPSVTAPLDPSAYLDDPCRLVPQETVAGLGYSDGGEVRDAEDDAGAALAGPGCLWEVSTGIRAIQLIIQTGARDDGNGGLRGGYEVYEEYDGFAYWEPTTVADHPAAFVDVRDQRDRGDCGMMVGLADDLSFFVTARGYAGEPDAACQDAETVAGQVIETLKGGA